MDQQAKSQVHEQAQTHIDDVQQTLEGLPDPMKHTLLAKMILDLQKIQGTIPDDM